MLDDMTKHLMSRPNNHAHLLYDLAHCIAAAVDADHANVYIHDKDGHITRFLPFDHEKRYHTNIPRVHLSNTFYQGEVSTDSLRHHSSCSLCQGQGHHQVQQSEAGPEVPPGRAWSRCQQQSALLPHLLRPGGH